MNKDKSSFNFTVLDSGVSDIGMEKEVVFVALFSDVLPLDLNIPNHYLSLCQELYVLKSPFIVVDIVQVKAI
jgi:hypothetical protein